MFKDVEAISIGLRETVRDVQWPLQSQSGLLYCHVFSSNSSFLQTPILTSPLPARESAEREKTRGEKTAAWIQKKENPKEIARYP